jgi:hypothetical protein
MKLSQGEYVALEKIESVYVACPVVQQICVHGDPMQSYLLAIVIPDPVVLAKIASDVWKKGVSGTDSRALDEAVKDERVVKAVLDMLTKDGVRYGLKGYVPPSPHPCVYPCDTIFPPAGTSSRRDYTSRTSSSRLRITVSPRQ